MFFKCECVMSLPGGLVETLILKLTLGVSDSVGPVWSLRIYISNKFPDDSDAGGMGNHI